MPVGVDKGRGWIYLLLDLLLRVVYVGSTQSYIPVRVLDHAKRAPQNNGRYYGSKEVLRGYEGFGKGRRHVCTQLAKVRGPIQELEMREGLLQASGFWMGLQNKRYKCWENDPNCGYKITGVRSFRLKMRKGKGPG